MRLEWNEQKGEREQVRAVGGQGLVGYRWASLLNEVGAMEGSGQRKMCPDPGVYRLRWLRWEEHSWGVRVGAGRPGWRHLHWSRQKMTAMWQGSGQGVGEKCLDTG